MPRHREILKSKMDRLYYFINLREKKSRIKQGFSHETVSTELKPMLIVCIIHNINCNTLNWTLYYVISMRIIAIYTLFYFCYANCFTGL